MEDIKVGEYVRTEGGRIGKIISKKPVYENDKLDYYLYLTSLNEFIYTEKQIKECGWRMGKNLIDLIKAGDYVNGIEVEEFDDDEGNLYLGFGIFTDSCMNCIEEIRPLSTVDIRTIVTKEQFESMEYIVGGKEE